MNQKKILGNGFEIAFIFGDSLIFTPHAHKEYIISANLLGNEDLILDGRSMKAQEGAITLYNPDQIQSGTGLFCLLSIYLEPHFFQQNCFSNSQVFFDSSIITNKQLLTNLRSFVTQVLDDTPPEIAEENILETIDFIFNRYTATKPQNITFCDKKTNTIKAILLDNIDKKISLDDLSNEININKLTLLKMFSRAVGYPPITWQRIQRIAIARQQLRDGKAISDIVYDLGFSDQSHLTRLFGKAYGISPMRFLKR